MFRLFHRFEEVSAAVTQPAAAEFYVLLEQLREAAQAGTPSWATYQTFRDYAAICFWAIRKLEYSFAAESFSRIEAEKGTPLRVLDVGCGVVPFCNWISRRGHDVVAIDPLESDIEFLKRNDLNAFYGSNVDYRVGRSEELDFPDASFDVVTLVSVLEHIAPGNDRLGLWEMGRVLKPGGKLIISFDVSPPPVLQEGQRPWPADRRRYTYPFAPAAAAKLFEYISSAFEVSANDLPDELKSLTWRDVHAFWRAAQAHDQREDPEREYLALAGVLTRRVGSCKVRSGEKTAALLEGQQALEERVEFYAAHAEQRMELVEKLDEVGQVLREEVEEKEQAIEELSEAAQEKEQVIGELSQAAQEKEQVIGELSQAAQEKEEVIGELSSAAHERERLIHSLQSIADERLAVIEQLKGHITLDQRVEQIEARMERLTSLLEDALSQHANAQMRLLQREKEMAETAAAARLEVIEEQQRALEAFRLAHVRFRWRERLKKYFTPRIGVLYHYNPRPLVVPPSYLKPRPLTVAPSISIVTPTLNQGQFIERTLRSVLEQDYPKLEYIVQDACSTDETPEILETFSGRLAQVVSERDAGLGDGLNRGLARATGEIMAYLNSDDILLPGALNYVASYFEKHPEVDVVYGHRVVIDEYDGEIGRWVLPPHDDQVLSWADFVPQETLFWRRSIWDKAGANIDETFRFAVDWDLLLRFRDAGARMRRLPRFLGGFRVHPHQKTSAELLEVGAREMSRLRERALGRDPSPLEVDKALRPYLRRHFVVHKLYRMGVLRY